MLQFEMRNFEEYQHYSKRNPPWIRVYYRLLQDRRFRKLDPCSKFVVIGLFLIASQHQNKVDAENEWLCDLLGLSNTPNWQAIVESEFIVPINCDASTLLAYLAGDACHSITDNSDNSESITEILSFSESTKRRAQDAIEVFKFWNSKPATTRHKSIDSQEKAIIKTLRRYSVEEINLCIERYSQVRANEAGKYRELYAWTLGEFLTRKEHYNIERFTADNWEQPFLAKSNGNVDKTKLDTIGEPPKKEQIKPMDLKEKEMLARIEQATTPEEKKKLTEEFFQECG